jgi:hypothetical protein
MQIKWWEYGPEFLEIKPVFFIAQDNNHAHFVTLGLIVWELWIFVAYLAKQVNLLKNNLA